jgi:tetratricopeptide (TPR) repeat protein
MRRVLALALLALSALFVVDAEAQPKADVACANRAQARRVFDRGHLAYRRGEYERAILDWQESFALCEEPLIYLNIANAYERLGELRDARKNLGMWREKAPQRELAELDRRLENLDLRIAELDKKEAADKAEADRRAKEEADRRAAEEAARQGGTPPKKGGGLGTLQFVGIGLAAFGGAAVIAGVIMDAVAATSRPDEEEACSGGLCRDDLRADIENSNTLAIAGDVTWIAGAAIGATGATILILSAAGVIKGKGDGDVALAPLIVPLILPQGAGVLFSAEF